jgi:ABC-type nickel/cobalt efflux system permease component RcnA
MTQENLIIVLIASVLLLALVGWLVWRAQKRRELKMLFGPEYQRAVEAAGDRRKAEAELEGRRRRVEKFGVHPLPEGDRLRYAEAWRSVQVHFVDDPRRAVNEADGLVGEVMNARGYPMAEFEQRAADVSVDHPHVVTHYRAAHQVAMRDGSAPASTEELRTALLHYRALFQDLLEVPTLAETRAS